MVFNTFSMYFDKQEKKCASASHFGRGKTKNNPRFVFLGTWQASQGRTLPYYRDGKLYRFLRGVEVLYWDLESHPA